MAWKFDPYMNCNEDQNKPRYFAWAAYQQVIKESFSPAKAWQKEKRDLYAQYIT